MAILQSTTSVTGLVGVAPRLVFIATNDTEVAITTTGYLNSEQAVNQGFSDGDMALVTTKTSPSATDVSVGWFQINYASGNWSLAPTSSPGDVTLPTIANHIAVFTNTTGTLSEDASTAINGGNIQAGVSGTAGALISFPTTALKGSLQIVAVPNTGNTLVTVSNAAHGQASIYTIPDGGQTTSNFLISNSAGTQTIDTGSLALSLGGLTLGSSGHVSSLTIFPGTAANGTLIVTAGNAGGAFNTTITSGTIGQSTTYTIPDIGAATGGIVVSTTAMRVKMVVAAAAAGGAAAQSFSDAFCTSASVVTGAWVTQTTPASVLTIVPGNGSFIVTSSANAGVGTFSYVIHK